MSRQLFLAAPLFSLLSLTVAGCTDDEPSKEPTPPKQITFAKLTAPQREAALRSAMGMSTVQGFFALFVADLDASDETKPCPTRTVNGTTLTYVANGCTSVASGITYRGKAVAENSALLDGLFPNPPVPHTDANRAMKVSFENFHADKAPATLTLDGSFSQSSPTPTAAYTASADLSINDGVALHIVTNFSCEGPNGFCASAAGDYGEIADLGRFELETHVKLMADGAGTVTLRGTDTLRLDFADRQGDCVPYSIDGVKAGELCRAKDSDPDPDPKTDPTADSTELTGVGNGCDDATASFWASTRGVPTSVKIFAKVGNKTATYPLAFKSHNDAGNEEDYEANVPLADSPMSCSELGQAGIRAIAYFPDGVECKDAGFTNELAGVACE